jgi:UPF0755 protein
MAGGSVTTEAVRPTQPAHPVVFAVLATALALSACLAHTLLRAPAGAGTGQAKVGIAPGSDLRQIARALGAAGVVSDPRAFVLAARLAGADRRLRPGEYRLDPAQTLPSLVRALLEGSGRFATVTVPEGWRLEQIAQRLAGAGICDAAAFLRAARDRALLADLGVPGPSAEGFLFPDTYSLTLPTPPVEVLRAMHRQFSKVWGELAAGAGPQTLTQLQAVTLASIVERETGLASERPLVAAVFLNRLRVGMPLQADPTVIYGIDGFDGNIRRSDLADRNPYNTYVVRGLPPGPIAAPGRAALDAVLRPAAVDHLYFVARNDGSHQFSRTLAEHNRAVQRYQLAGARRRG